MEEPFEHLAFEDVVLCCDRWRSNFIVISSFFLKNPEIYNFIIEVGHKSLLIHPCNFVIKYVDTSKVGLKCMSVKKLYE